LNHGRFPTSLQFSFNILRNFKKSHSRFFPSSTLFSHQLVSPSSLTLTSRPSILTMQHKTSRSQNFFHPTNCEPTYFETNLTPTSTTTFSPFDVSATETCKHRQLKFPRLFVPFDACQRQKVNRIPPTKHSCLPPFCLPLERNAIT
jgi:hypothetical protein